MKAFVLPLLVMSFSFSALALNVDAADTRINQDKPVSPTLVSSTPMDILAAQARRGTDYEAKREEAVIKAYEAISEATSQEAYDNAVTKFMDLARPEEMAGAFGQSLAETADMNSGLDFKAMVEQASGGVEITVDIGSQTLSATSPNGSLSGIPISSAGTIGGVHYATKRGCFNGVHPEVMHHSKKYHNSPMPHSLFYSGGFAIHGTNAENHLGHPASHGCVRVSRANAARLYALVMASGARNTRVCVH